MAGSNDSNLPAKHIAVTYAEHEGSTKASRKIRWLDIVMIILAAFSVLLLILESVVSLSEQQRLIIIYADLTIVAVFIFEFVYNMRKQESKVDYVIERWYDIIGMIPAAHPVFRGFRLFRIFRVVIIASRFLRTLDLTFGRNILFRILNKYKNLIVDELYQLITIRSLDMIKDMVGQTDYSNSARKVLVRRQDEINDMLVEKMDKYVQPGWIAGNFLYKKVRDQSSNLFTNVVIDTLEDERINDILVEVITEVMEDIKLDLMKAEKIVDD